MSQEVHNATVIRVRWIAEMLLELRIEEIEIGSVLCSNSRRVCGA